MFITFEGIEGSGKTTHVDLLSDYLEKQGHRVVRTREPGGTPVGEALRSVLLKKDLRVLPLTELLVFLASRAQHVEEVIRPALEEGNIVLCDRFVDASYAYQGYGRGIDLGIIETLNRLVTKGVRPNLTILLDCTVEVGLGRKSADGHLDRFEKEELSFHQKIRSAYLELAEDDPKRFVVLNAKKDVAKTQEVIREKVERLLKSHGV
ncbi:MAG TPA: dTMP kinase [Deltaproteobacteria bacterium]|nr:dTMP kinase [Deltaproteobacteria bacterium]